MLNAHPTIFRFPVLGLLSSFIFVWIDLTGCTKKKLNFSIPIRDGIDQARHDFARFRFSTTDQARTDCARE